jgi:hypothetical protein
MPGNHREHTKAHLSDHCPTGQTGRPASANDCQCRQATAAADDLERTGSRAAGPHPQPVEVSRKVNPSPSGFEFVLFEDETSRPESMSGWISPAWLPAGGQPICNRRWRRIPSMPFRRLRGSRPSTSGSGQSIRPPGLRRIGDRHPANPVAVISKDAGHLKALVLGRGLGGEVEKS